MGVPRRPTRTVPTVIVCGWEGSGPEHWQRWLQQQLIEAGREVIFVELPDVDHPRLHPWLETLRAALRDLPADAYDVVCHSLGAMLWLHHVTSDPQTPRPARVALVSPPSPQPQFDTEEIATFYPVPLDIDAVRAGADGTVLVAGSDDPYLPEGIGEAYGRPLKMAATVIDSAGHLNTESGYGAWPAILDWCGRDNLAFY